MTDPLCNKKKQIEFKKERESFQIFRLANPI